MTFSVVVPNFNHGKLLVRAILALMAQNPSPSEIIIINDASTDDSLAVITRLQERFPCIHLINHDRNRGTVAGLNEGLAAATDELIYFAAADDYTFPNFFALVNQSLANHPEAAFFCGRVVVVDPSGNILGFRPFMRPASQSAMLTPAEVRAKLAMSDNWSVGASVIYRRNRLLEAGGFDERMGAFSDGIIVRRLALESGFYFATTVVAALERYPESLSAQTALSTEKSARLVPTAVASVRANFPPDIREVYAHRLERRLRFNMAALWLAFGRTGINTDHMADILQFKGVTRSMLGLIGRLPFARVGILMWMGLVLRPYALSAIIVGWYRAMMSSFESPEIARLIAQARDRSM